MEKNYLSFIFLLIVSTIYAQVGIGRDVARGALDLNNNTTITPNISSLGGLVLPINSDILNTIKKPNGQNPALGTAVYDISAGKNCIRVYGSEGWSDCLLDKCEDPQIRSARFTTPTSPLLASTIDKDRMNKASFALSSGQAIVGIGKEEAEGVMDLNNGNPFGLVLPSAYGVDGFITPQGSTAVEGTLVYDFEKNCPRFKRQTSNALDAWSGCLLTTLECTFDEKEELFGTSVQWGARDKDLNTFTSGNLATTATKYIHLREHMQGVTGAPKGVYYGVDAGGLNNTLNVGNKLVKNGITIIDVDRPLGIEMIQTKNNELNLNYLIRNFDVYSTSPLGRSITSEAQAKLATDNIEKFVEQGGLAIISLDYAGGSADVSYNINNYILRKYGYGVVGVTSAVPAHPTVGQKNMNIIRVNNNDINDGIFGNVKGLPSLRHDSANNPIAIAGDWVFVPIVNIEGREGTEIIAEQERTYKNAQGQIVTETGAMAWFGGPGNRILFLASPQFGVQGGGYSEQEVITSPSFQRDLRVFTHNMISYLLSRKVKNL